MYSFKDFVIANPSMETDELISYMRQKRKRNEDVITTVEDLSEEDFDTMLDMDEALTNQQRMKMKATFRKNKGKIAIAKKKAAKKQQTQEEVNESRVKDLKDLETLSIAYEDKLRKGKDFKVLTKQINQIKKKLLPQIKKTDREKLKSKGEEK